MSEDVLVRVDRVGKKFCRDLRTSLWYGVKDVAADILGRGDADQPARPGEFWALEDISFELRRGECLGLVGRNGAGKTTLLKMLNGLIKPDRGRIEVRGRVGALIALGAGFNPLLTGRENVYINGAVLGLTKREIDETYDDIVDFAELGDFINAPVQSYSSGMQVRLGFAVATALKPDVLLLDEVLAVGDVAFRAKCFERIGKVLVNAAVIFVSHSEAQIQRICDRALLMVDGRVAADGPPEPILKRYHETWERVTGVATDIRHPAVTHLNIEARQVTVPWGGELEVSLSLTLSESITLGATYLHLWRDGDFIASGNVVHDEVRGHGLILGAGESHLTIRLGPLHLQSGVYSLALAAFDPTRKQTMLHLLHFAEVQVDGPRGVGSTHLIPMAVENIVGHGKLPKIKMI